MTRVFHIFRDSRSAWIIFNSVFSAGRKVNPRLERSNITLKRVCIRIIFTVRFSTVQLHNIIMSKECSPQKTPIYRITNHGDYTLIVHLFAILTQKWSPYPEFPDVLIGDWIQTDFPANVTGIQPDTKLRSKSSYDTSAITVVRGRGDELCELSKPTQWHLKVDAQLM